ncbi:MAG: hypothetical protein U9Q81_10000 [Pseudomonadota bacterium]|nr:hypothetical protein [Pseudomonadota bacterium]
MVAWIGHWHQRELRFLGLLVITGLIIGLYLSESLRIAGQEGTGWRTIDLEALQQRIETGELSEREADWYHPARPDEVSGIAGGSPK